MTAPRLRVEALEDRVVPATYVQNFDALTAPTLPTGWSNVNNAGANPWATNTTTSVSAPNSAFAADPGSVSDTFLLSPVFAISAASTLAFRNNFNTENTFDGGVLEVSIGGAAFADIITAGGSFNTGGYTGTINGSSSNPIGGRQAWTGNSGGFGTTSVALPAAAVGPTVQFRWRMTTDGSVNATGWRIDDVQLTNASAPLVFTAAPASAVASYTLRVAGADFQIVDTANPTTVLASQTAAATSSITFTGRVGANDTFVLDTSGGDLTTPLTFLGGGSAGDSDSLVKVGAGTARLTGQSVFTGSTTVAAGTLVLENPTNNIYTYTGGTVFINGASTFRIRATNPGATKRYDFQGKTFAFGATGGGTIDIPDVGTNVVFSTAAGLTNTIVTSGGARDSITGAAGFNLGANPTNTTVFNVARGTDPTIDLLVAVPLTNGAAVTKAGAGTLALAATNTYTGPTTVTAGTVLVNGSLAAASAVTASGTDPNKSTFLGGSGTIGGPVLVQAGAVIGPGDSNTTGTLTVRSLAFEAGGAFGVKVAGGAAGQFDALTVTTTANLANGGTFVVPTGPTPAAGTVLTVISNTSPTPTVPFAAFPEGATFNDAGGTTYRISYVGGDGNDVTLTALTGPQLQTTLVATGPSTGTGTVFAPTSAGYAAAFTANLVPGFNGETHVAVGDVNGDRVPDVVVGTGPGNSRVRVLDGASGLLTVLADFIAFPGYAGGVFVAAGDLNGDGFDDLAVTPDAVDAFTGPVSNQLPVRVYSGISMRNGTGSPTVLAAFDGLASLSGASGQGNPNVKLGGRPAIADVNGDGNPDLLIAAGNGGGPRITVWSGTGFPGAGGGQPTATPIANLFVFESSQRGGAFITAGDVNGDGFADVIVGGGPGGGPRVRVVNALLLFTPAIVPNLEGVNLDDPTNLSNGLVLNNFFAGSDALRGGVRVTVRDVDGDGLADVVVGSGTGELSGVRVYLSPSLAAVAGTSAEPAGAQTIDPFGAVLAGGVWVG